MPRRSPSSPSPRRVRTRHQPDADGLERRLDSLTTLVTELQRAVDLQSKRAAAIQAQVDHLDAKIRGN